MVVYIGMQTKTMMSSKYRVKKHDHYSYISNVLTVFTICFSFFFVLISIIVLLSRSDDVAYMKRYDENISNGMKIFNLFVLYSWLVPTNLFLILDLI